MRLIVEGVVGRQSRLGGCLGGVEGGRTQGASVMSRCCHLVRYHRRRLVPLRSKRTSNNKNILNYIEKNFNYNKKDFN